MSKAPNNERTASLISSHQMDVALMRRDDAATLRQGRPPFAGYGPVKLFTIVGIGEFLLVCQDDFATRHAWLICEAFDKSSRRSSRIDCSRGLRWSRLTRGFRCILAL